MGSRIARVLGLSLFLAAGVSCNSSTISGKGTGGCATTCSTSDAVWGAVGCNGAGACVYPDAGTGCPGTICSDGVVSGMVCDGAGACRPDIGTACPGNRGCTADGGCRISCATATDCASGFVCNAGACVVQLPPEAAPRTTTASLDLRQLEHRKLLQQAMQEYQSCLRLDRLRRERRLPLS